MSEDRKPPEIVYWAGVKYVRADLQDAMSVKLELARQQAGKWRAIAERRVRKSEA